MILFTILLIMCIVLALITIAAISAGGVLFIVLFGDVIICVWLLICIMKRIIRKKKNK